MNRRGFMGAILACGAAPWVAKAGVLMQVKEIWVPDNRIIELDAAYWDFYQRNVQDIDYQKALNEMARSRLNNVKRIVLSNGRYA